MAEDDCEGQTQNVYAILAYIGGFILALGPAYQFYKMYTKKHTSGVSIKFTINQLVGLTLVIAFSIRYRLYPILVGEVIEFINFILMGIYKIYLEKKIFKYHWGKPKVNELELDYTSAVLNDDKLVIQISPDSMDEMMIKYNESQNFDNVSQFILEKVVVEEP